MPPSHSGTSHVYLFIYAGPYIHILSRFFVCVCIFSRERKREKSIDMCICIYYIILHTHLCVSFLNLTPSKQQLEQH